jgi:5'-nucleotidase
VPRLLILALLLALGCSDGASTKIHGEVELVVLHTSDTHSALFPFRERIGWSDAQRGLGNEGSIETIGGFSRLVGLARRERARGKRVLSLDSGDAFQGSLAFDEWGGEPELLALGALGVRAQALGNHELDRGADNLRERYRELATFPLLAANYVADSAASIVELVAPYVVLDVEGLRVGVVGVGNVRSLPALAERPNELGVLAEDAAGAVQGAVDELRPLVDVVVVLTHLGLEADVRLVRETNGVDVILGGHGHIALDEPLVAMDCGGSGEGSVRDAWGRRRRCVARRVLVVHSAAYAKYLGKLALTLDDDPARFGVTYDPLDAHEVTDATFDLLPVRADLPEDPATRELLEPYRQGAHERLGLGDVLGYAPETVARIGATGADSPLGNFAARAARVAARADVAVIGASSLRRDLARGALDAEALEQSFPFDDPVLRVPVTGSALLAAFERAATTAAERDCRTPLHVAGALVRLACPCTSRPCARAFVEETDVCCDTDADCAALSGACDAAKSPEGDSAGGRCFLPVSPLRTYVLATTAYLADGNGEYFEPEASRGRERAADGLREAVNEALHEAEPCAGAASNCDAAKPSEGDSEGCPAALRKRVEGALGDVGSPFSAADCERVRAFCRALPCLDQRAGAVRDGRLRIERP